MNAFWISMVVVAAAEFGDKTQFLALLFGARFKRPVPILLGILVSTAVNHTLVSLIGVWLSNHIDGMVLRWVLGILFLAVAVWTLRLDKLDKAEVPAGSFEGFGAFATTFLTFFVAEMGDKTQLATIALAVKFNTLLPVIAGTTLGVMLINGPVVLIGDAVSSRVPVHIVRYVAAAVFGCLGILAISGISF
ncbi:MAG: TMEM165/GDT1 family protein [Nitrospiria bacterium]